jgi:hypothetical protein
VDPIWKKKKKKKKKKKRLVFPHSQFLVAVEIKYKIIKYERKKEKKKEGKVKAEIGI